jgi:hypothetical protein
MSISALPVIVLWVASAPDISAIQTQAIAAAEHHADVLICQADVLTEQMDKKGKVTDTERRIYQSTWRDGDEHASAPTQVWRNRKELDAAAQKKIDDDWKKEHAAKKGTESAEVEIESPLTKKSAGAHTFSFLRQETLWGRETYVLAVKAKDKKGVNGTAWIDAATFIELKGDYVPTSLPAHADWMTFQEQFVQGPSGDTQPSLVHVEGAGHFLFFSGGAKSTMRWSSCH